VSVREKEEGAVGFQGKKAYWGKTKEKDSQAIATKRGKKRGFTIPQSTLLVREKKTEEKKREKKSSVGHNPSFLTTTRNQKATPSWRKEKRKTTKKKP